MAQILDMPQLSDTMRQGVLRKWRKNEGEKMVPGEVLAEVETDKATMDFEIFDHLLARPKVKSDPHGSYVRDALGRGATRRPQLVPAAPAGGRVGRSRGAHVVAGSTPGEAWRAYAASTSWRLG